MTGQLAHNASDDSSENMVVFSIGPVDFHETTILFAAIVLLVGLLCCVTLILLCRVCCTKKGHDINNKQNELKMKDVHVKCKNMKQSNINNNNSNKVNNNNDLIRLSNERKPLEIVFNNSEPDTCNVALPNVNMHYLIATRTKKLIKQKDDNDSIDNSHLDAGIEELFGDQEYTIEGEKDAHISKSNLNSTKTALSPTRSESSNSRSVLNVRNQPNYMMETSGVVSIPYDNIDESNYQEWSEKQVLLWFKKVLSTHNVEKQLISSFLKELSTKCVSGKRLDQFKNNNEMLLAFQSQFSTKHRAFAMWLALQTAIDDLGSSKQ